MPERRSLSAHYRDVDRVLKRVWLRIRLHYRTVYGGLILGAIITLVVLLFLQNLSFFVNTELSVYDFHIGHRLQPVKPNPSIVVVGLDRDSLDELNHGATPIPRHWMANVLDFLHQAHARAIGLDFLYEPTHAAEDRVLNRAMQYPGTDFWTAAGGPGGPPQTLASTASALDGKIYLFAARDPGGSTSLESYNPATNQWSTVAHTPNVLRGGAAAAGADQGIYAIGGRTGGRYSGQVRAWIIGNRATTHTVWTWEARAPMPTPRAGLSAAADSSFNIYAVGGRNGRGYLRSLEVDDIGDPRHPLGIWREAAPMPTARADLATIAGSDGLLYAVGGRNGTGYLRTVEVYDPQKNAWSRRAPMPTARAGLVLVAGQGSTIYALGGRNRTGYLRSVEAYDPITNRWISKTPMPAPQPILAAGASPDGQIFAVGGKNKGGSSARVWAYRPGNVVVAQELSGSAAVTGQNTVSVAPLTSTLSPAGVGIANYPVDRDNEMRADYLTQPVSNGNSPQQDMPAFPLTLASVARRHTVSQTRAGLPLHMYINFTGAQPPFNPELYTFQMHQFLSLARFEESKALYRNKIVLVIPADAVRIGDVHSTPVGQMYGGIVQANTVSTILSGTYITPAGSTGNSLIILIVGLITTIVASRFGVFQSILGVLLIFVGYIFLTRILFDSFHVWVDLITPETVVVLVVAAVMGLRFATEERRRRRAARMFGQYVKPEIVDILMNAPDEETALAGGRRSISVLFVDVRGFTRMSEAMEPEDVVRALDVYLEELTVSVQAYDGTVDKYVGDEVMAIWNAPSYQEDHALRAVLSGLDMMSRMDSINRQLRDKGLPAVKYGIGINSGDAVVGQMGSSFRKQYDVIGDTVNTAARLCSAAAGGEIIIGEETWEMIGDRLLVEETEPLALKGKSREFRTFRVLGLQPDSQAPAHAVPASA